MRSIMSQIKSAQGAKAPMAGPRGVKPEKQRRSIMSRIQEMIANAPMSGAREERNAKSR